jgi:hypothetical protein
MLETLSKLDELPFLMLQYYFSIALNFIIWLLSVYVVIRYYTRKSLPFKTKGG